MIFVRLIVQTVFFAVGQMLSNKVRAFLTTLGIIIGVWAITSVIAAVGGLKNFVLDEFAKFGATKVFIWGNVPDSLRDKVTWEEVRLSPADGEALRKHSETLERLTMQTSLGATVSHGDKIKQGVRVTGIEPDWHEIEQRFVMHGRALTQSDDEGELQVCLVNEQAIEELTLEKGGVGSYIFINNRRFLVVGVVETKEMSPMFGGGEARTEVFIPFRLAYRLRDWPWVEITAQMKSPDIAEDCKEEIRFILRKHRQLPADWEDTFEMFQMTQALENFRGMAAAMTASAGVLVGISLLVGGIGIMNIMLVSVSERTREIGLRKAVGANPVVILLQFLIEAVILCIAGGVVGLIAGQATTLALRNIPDFPMEGAEIPVWAILLAFFFSAGVGVVFGMWPAIKAARLNPIEALRHE